MWKGDKSIVKLNTCLGITFTQIYILFFQNYLSTILKQHHKLINLFNDLLFYVFLVRAFFRCVFTHGIFYTCFQSGTFLDMFLVKLPTYKQYDNNHTVINVCPAVVISPPPHTHYDQTLLHYVVQNEQEVDNLENNNNKDGCHKKNQACITSSMGIINKKNNKKTIVNLLSIFCSPEFDLFDQSISNYALSNKRM